MNQFFLRRYSQTIVSHSMMTYPEQPLENAIQKRLGPANDPCAGPDEGRTKADKTAGTCNPMPHHTASKPDSLHNATETV